MLPKYTIPVIAAAGFAFAVYSVAVGAKPAPVSQHLAEPAKAPFSSYIAAAGIIEAKTNNINIGTPVAGIVKRIFVKWGDKVRAGGALFALDDRELAAELGVRMSELARAKAVVSEAGAILADVKSQLDIVEGITDRRAISVDDLERRRNAVLIARAKLDSAGAQAEAAAAMVRAAQTNIDRLTVRSPVDAEVLQVNIRPGEYAQTGFLATPLMMIGNVDNLHVRVDIDENDAWRFLGDARAAASLRGNRDYKASLSFVRVEPFVLPKRSLTGDSTERVDTRVLQVIYSFRRGDLPAYVGQQMDVFIEAPSAAGAAQTQRPLKDAEKGKES
ncbi:MAG: efflux RND transporter periplasmic adaptor subunit [Deltaproteobacteria bacterium]|nr:efflux RND transporter periplasmic adaptor subunit [Deltaproteobacteria bacterium]